MENKFKNNLSLSLVMALRRNVSGKLSVFKVKRKSLSGNFQPKSQNETLHNGVTSSHIYIETNSGLKALN